MGAALERLGSSAVSHAIEVNQMGVSFGPTLAVDDLSFSVEFGEVLCVLGPNGAGKTTAVETLLGFRAPNKVTARLFGFDPVRHHREVVQRTGALLQRGGVWFPMTPRQVLRLTATYYAAPRDADELLRLLDLEGCAATPWRRLSGGEQQRTLLALALLGRPRALVLDEPTASVDPEGRQVIRELIEHERARGCALLITTHELQEAERLASRVLIVHRGRVVTQGTLDELAGEQALIIETSSAIDAGELAAVLHCAVREDSPRRYHCASDPSPENLAIVTSFLQSRGVSLTSLDTRASLEETYLRLIGEQRSERS